LTPRSVAMTGSMGSTDRHDIALANTLVQTTSRNGRLENRMAATFPSVIRSARAGARCCRFGWCLGQLLPRFAHYLQRDIGARRPEIAVQVDQPVDDLILGHAAVVSGENVAAQLVLAT